MAITRYTARRPTLTPWTDFDLLGTRLNRLLGDWPQFESGAGHSSLFPAMNVEETPEGLILTAELPGMRREDIEIELENNILTISGEKRDERTEDEKERRYHVWERRYGTFQRAFTLPRSVKADAISAEFLDGILTVTMPKAEEAKGRRISVGGASGS